MEAGEIAMVARINGEKDEELGTPRSAKPVRRFRGKNGNIRKTKPLSLKQRL
jgi:hypothetical protein